MRVEKINKTPYICLMDHRQAVKIFEELQARPYGLCLAPGVPANNCVFKSMELIQRLGMLGYTVRGRIGDSYWDKNLIPAEIIDLLPTDMPCTHFYTEVMVDGEWTIADTSLQPSMAQYGFTIGSFGKGGRSCFPITKLYTQEEAMAYMDSWADPKYAEDCFAQCGAGWNAINEWFAERAS